MGMGYHNVVIKDGKLYGCGLNSSGELGLGHTNSPVSGLTEIPGITNIKMVAVGGNHTLVLLNDGTVYATGANGNGQLGLNNKTNRSTFTKIDTLSNIKFITCGYWNSFAITEDGHVYAWGINNYGELGLGNNIDKIIPTLSNYINNVKKIAAGQSHTAYLLENGDVYASGYASYIYITSGATPAKLPLSDTIDIACSCQHSLFLLKDGTVWGSGYNYYGSLASAANGYTYNEINILSGLSNIKKVYASYYSSYALTNDNKLYALGSNAYGELGIGYADYNVVHQSPVSVFENVKQVDCGFYTLYVMDQSNKLYCCGDNGYHQYGIPNNIIQKSTLSLVDTLPTISSLADNVETISIMTPSVLKVTPTHMYNNNTNCIIECSISYLEGITESDKYIKYQTKIGTNVIQSSSNFELITSFNITVPLSALSTGNNKIDINIETQTGQKTESSQYVKREELYRLISERTFLKVDGGYGEKYIDKTNNKALPVNGNSIQTITGPTSISLDPRCKSLFTTIPEIMIPNDQITAYCNVTPYGATSAQKLFNGILTDDSMNEGIHVPRWEGEILIPMLLTSPYRVTSLMYYTYGSTQYQPFNFSIDGSNDTTTGFDGTWVELKKVVHNPLRIAPNAWGTITIPNTKYYKAYRLRILNCTDDGISPRNYLVLNELKLMHQ